MAGSGDARKAAVIAMLVAAALSIGWGAYQLANEGTAIPFFIGGALLGAFASIVSAASKKPPAG